MGRAVLLVLLAVLAVASANRVNPKNAFRNHTAVCDEACQTGEVAHIGQNRVMPLKTVEFDYCRASGFCPSNMDAVHQGIQKCRDGEIQIHMNDQNGHGTYKCHNIDLLSYISAEDLGSSMETSDIWGATLYFEDEHSGQEEPRFLAIIGHSDGTSFVDVTDAIDPTILGFLPTTDCGRNFPLRCSRGRIWRDIKVYGDRAFIVSENYGHGMQVVDLRALYTEELKQGHVRLSAQEGPQTLTETSHYSEFGKAHNIALNEDTGYAYVIGSNTCDGGLHVIDVAQETPRFAGCYAEDGYTHDCQCVSYDKPYPDPKYHGHEICFNFNEDTLTIVDVTDKEDMKMVSRISYNGVQYSHQGWLTEDGKYLLLDDELDEQQGSTYTSDIDTTQHGGHTRTLIWDVDNLEKPMWVKTYLSDETAIDHNLYMLDNRAYQSNYCAGLRVMDVENPLEMYEHGYFDLAPYCSGTSFEGSWSNYPYYYNHPENKGRPDDDEDPMPPMDMDMGNKFQVVAVSSIERGLYMMRVRMKDLVPF